MVEKTIMVSKEEYEELQRITKAGGDPSKVRQLPLLTNRPELLTD